MLTYLILNVLLGLLWQVLNGALTAQSLFTGLVLGWLVLSLVEPDYGRRSLHLVGFLFYLAYAILESNVRLAWLIVQPKLQIDPAIIAVPLTASTGFEITVLATIITLTPGTLSVELGRTSDGKRTLLVHSLTVGDPERFRADIHRKMERRLLQVTRSYLSTE